MRGPFMLWRFRFSSLALGMSILFAVGGLFAMDRLLVGAGLRQARIEAVESAALVEGFLAVHVEALQSIRGLYLADERVPADRAFGALIDSFDEYAPTFRRVVVTDSTARVMYQQAFGTGAAPFQTGMLVDTVQLLDLGDVARDARSMHHACVTRAGLLPDGVMGFGIVEPLYVGPRFLGFAIGTVPSEALLRSVMMRRPHIRGRLLIVAGRDTIQGPGPTLAGGSFEHAVATSFNVPGGMMWQVVVLPTTRSETVRVPLWIMGLMTLGALVIALLHERRQGIRLAERSAELERLSQELLRANRAKSEFLANVSHELRTPLNAIVGFVDLLRDGVYGELTPRQAGPVDRIASSATHLRQLVDQVLDLAKMAAGRLEVHPEMVDLRPLVLNVASEVEALVSEHGLNLSIAVPATLPRIRTDPLHVRQILVNLLGNAVKFTRTGGIAIRARIASEADALAKGIHPGGLISGTGRVLHSWVALQVADSGIGIAVGDRARIFEEFEQVNAGPRGDSMRRGTGLGLPISRRLARLLGGDITLETELAKGSTFTVWLPVDTTPTAPVPEPTTPTVVEAGESKLGSGLTAD